MWLVEWGRASTCIGSRMDVSALSSLHLVMHTGEFICPSRHIDSRSVVFENECLRQKIRVFGWIIYCAFITLGMYMHPALGWGWSPANEREQR